MGRFIELRQRASAASVREGQYYIRPNPVMGCSLSALSWTLMDSKGSTDVSVTASL